MDSGLNGGNAIYLIGGDDANNQVDKLLPPEEFGQPNTSFDANPNLTHEGDVFIMENKRRLCKTFNAKGSCPFGDKCVFIHDEESRRRESTVILLVDAGYQNGGVTRSGGPVAAPPIAPFPSRPPAMPQVPLPARPPAVPLTQAASDDTLKPMNWRTRICRRWEEAGYCPFGNKCYFAHGEAELQQLGVPEANPNNHGFAFPNVVAGTRSSVACTVGVSGSSVDDAAGSEQGRVQRCFSKWPVGINRIYGDWIDDIE